MFETLFQITPQMLAAFLNALAVFSIGVAALLTLVCLIGVGCLCRSEARLPKRNNFGLIAD